MEDVLLPASPKAALPTGETKLRETELAPQEFQRFTLRVTEEDLYWSERSGLRNPILCALQRHTKTLWRLYDCGLALEAMPPYRACQLPDEAIEKWRQWQLTGELIDPEWEVKLVPNVSKDGYSMIQHRSTNLQAEVSKRCRASATAAMSSSASQQKTA